MRKKGFTLPVVQWMRGPLKDFVREKLTALAQDEALFRPDRVLAMRDGRDTHSWSGAIPSSAVAEFRPARSATRR